MMPPQPDPTRGSQRPDDLHERAEFAPEITFLRAFERVEREMAERNGRPMRPFRALRASMEALGSYRPDFIDEAFVKDVQAIDAQMREKLTRGKHSMGEHEYVEPYLRVYKSLLLRRGMLVVERARTPTSASARRF